MSSNSNHVKSAIKNLPEAFRSASSSIDQTSEESRRVSLRDTSYGMFYAGSCVRDVNGEGPPLLLRSQRFNSST